MSIRKIISQAWLIIPLPFLLAAVACQQGRSTVVIGVLSQTPALAETLEGFKYGMSQLGYVDGEGINYLYNGPTDFGALESEADLTPEVSIVD